jgi:hypothetical protein
LLRTSGSKRSNKAEHDKRGEFFQGALQEVRRTDV